MARKLKSSYYKGMLADEDLYENLKNLSYKDKELIA